MDLSQCITEYNLPSKELIEAELGALSFEDEDKVIIELTKSLREKVSKYIHFLEELIQPDSSFISMQESSCFSDAQRSELFLLFKKLILLQRTYLLIDLDGADKDHAVYFKQLFAGWATLKQSLKPVIQKTLSVWGDKEALEEVKQNYFG